VGETLQFAGDHLVADAGNEAEPPNTNRIDEFSAKDTPLRPDNAGQNYAEAGHFEADKRFWRNMRSSHRLETIFRKVDDDNVTPVIALDKRGLSRLDVIAFLAPPVRRSRLNGHACSNAHQVTPTDDISLFG